MHQLATLVTVHTSNPRHTRAWCSVYPSCAHVLDDRNNPSFMVRMPNIKDHVVWWSEQPLRAGEPNLRSWGRAGVRQGFFIFIPLFFSTSPSYITSSSHTPSHARDNISHTHNTHTPLMCQQHCCVKPASETFSLLLVIFMFLSPQTD